MDNNGLDLPAEFSQTPPFVVGEWTVQPSLNRVTRLDETRSLRPRVMHLLVCLAERPGEVVSRRTLLHTLWPNSIVGEEGLTVAISELRGVFGDNSKQSNYVETIRKGGYRLVASVEPVTANPIETKSESVAGRANDTPTTGGSFLSVRIAVIAGVLIVFICLSVVFLTQRNGSLETINIDNMTGVPLTSYPSSEVYPAFSPDGNRVAFSWSFADTASLDIWVVTGNRDNPLRLTTNPGTDLAPIWSPDGNTIAFYRESADRGLYTVSSIGGQEHLLLRTDQPIRGFDWSPDGRYIVYSSYDVDAQLMRLSLLVMDGLESQLLPIENEPQVYSNLRPRFSPDGNSIAFVRRDYGNVEDIWVTSVLEPSKAHRVTWNQVQVSGLTWTADGKEILYSASPESGSHLYRVNVNGGQIRRVSVPGRQVHHPAISRSGDRLVFEEYLYNYNIRMANLDNSEQAQMSDIPLISSTRNDCGGCYSPDGTRLAFVSTRTGNTEVWTCNRDGSEPSSLTDFQGLTVLQPSWSPNSKLIAFTAIEEGLSVVYVADVSQRYARRLSSSDRHESFAGWSSDGQSVWLEAVNINTREIIRTNITTGESEILVEDARRWIHETTDGKTILYFRRDERGLWEMDLTTGEYSCLLTPERISELNVIGGWKQGIIYGQVVADKVQLIYQKLGETATDTLAVGLDPNLGGFELAPDGKSILYNHIDSFECDLILVEDFE